MSDLPPGWEWTTLGDIAETSLGKMLDKGRSSNLNLVPYLRNANVQWGRFDLSDVLTMDIRPELRGAYEVKAGDLLVCEGGEIGRCAIWPGSATYMAYQKALHRVRLLDGVDPRYLRYLLEHLSINNELLPYSSGSTIKHLPQQQLRRLLLPLAPTVEQRRIVAALEGHLSRMDVGDSQVFRAKKKLDALERSMLDQIITDGSGNWPIVQLQTIARVTSGATPLKSRTDYYEGGDIPWVTSSQLNDRLVTTVERFITKKALDETAVKLLPAGSILVAMYGEGKTRGKCSELSFPATTNQACAAIVLDSRYEKYRPWVKVFFEANYESNRRLSAGGVQPNLNLGLIKNMTLPLPPIDEGTLLLAQLDNHRQMMDRLKVEAAKAQQLAKRLQRSLLADAFAGRLVPQDPNAEPASVLLERIRAERKAQPKLMRARRSRQPATTQEVLL